MGRPVYVSSEQLLVQRFKALFEQTRTKLLASQPDLDFDFENFVELWDGNDRWTHRFFDFLIVEAASRHQRLRAGDSGTTAIAAPASEQPGALTSYNPRRRLTDARISVARRIQSERNAFNATISTAQNLEVPTPRPERVTGGARSYGPATDIPSTAVPEGDDSSESGSSARTSSSLNTPLGSHYWTRRMGVQLDPRVMARFANYSTGSSTQAASNISGNARQVQSQIPPSALRVAFRRYRAREDADQEQGTGSNTRQRVSRTSSSSHSQQQVSDQMGSATTTGRRVMRSTGQSGFQTRQTALVRRRSVPIENMSSPAASLVPIAQSSLTPSHLSAVAPTTVSSMSHQSTLSSIAAREALNAAVTGMGRTLLESVQNLESLPSPPLFYDSSLENSSGNGTHRHLHTAMLHLSRLHSSLRSSDTVPGPSATMNHFPELSAVMELDVIEPIVSDPMGLSD